VFDRSVPERFTREMAVTLGDWKTRLMKDPSRIMEAYLATTQG